MSLLNIKYSSLLRIAFLVYVVITKIIFDSVFSISTNIIDEQFHIPQGIAYCNRDFSYWDSKITTLPGLYLISAPIGFFLECNAYNLRMINYLGSCLNFLLLASILRYVYSTEDPKKVVLQAINLAILPPLYFFAHIYYTDTWSLTFLLIYSRLCLKNENYCWIFVFGFLSVLMRQTNIVWVSMMLLQNSLYVFIRTSKVYGNTDINPSYYKLNSITAIAIDSSKLKRYYSVYDIDLAGNYHLINGYKTFFYYYVQHDLYLSIAHSSIITLFLMFFVYNGSIVVGDKTAHEATLHLPQLLYFLLFYGFFGLPHVLFKIPSTLRLMLTKKGFVMIYFVLMLLAVHFNTVAHPYLLADNRHYTFYIWNRWFGKYVWAKYATIPAYLFLLYSLYDNLKDANCITFLMPYTLNLIVVLVLQKMIEVRYFLVPYIILRLRFERPSWKAVIFEFFWYIAVNYATFNLFFSKEIEWANFSDIQRLIW